MFLDHEIDDNKIADLEGKVNKVTPHENFDPLGSVKEALSRDPIIKNYFS